MNGERRHPVVLADDDDDSISIPPAKALCAQQKKIAKRSHLSLMRNIKSEIHKNTDSLCRGQTVIIYLTRDQLQWKDVVMEKLTLLGYKVKFTPRSSDGYHDDPDRISIRLPKQGWATFE